MRVKRSPLVILATGALLLAAVLFVAGFLRGQNHYPDPVALAAATPYQSTFFDPDPKHPWNQLYGLLFIRPAWNGKLYGQDELDPLYWHTSLYLLDQPLHQKVLTFLDQFIQSDAAHLVQNSLKRALLQRMLWALFDRWASFDPYTASATDPLHRNDPRDYAAERRELQVRLVKIMRAVALTKEEIDALPKNYQAEAAAKIYPAEFDPNSVEEPFLPATFFSQGDWVELGTARYELVAPVHTKGVSGRSNFHVLISLPTGRNDTLAYLKRLHDFQPHWTYDEAKRTFFGDAGNDGPPWTNADVPQIPLLTKFALVRTANLIDNQGEIESSPLVETVQIRVIRSILTDHSSGGEQTFLMFEVDPAKLMKGDGGLVAKAKGGQGFDLVLNDYSDPLQVTSRRRDANPDKPGQFDRVSSCFGCHSRPGIFSMNSYIQFFQDKRTLQPPELQEGSSWSVGWKQGQYDWGLLQAYWFAQ